MTGAAETATSADHRRAMRQRAFLGAKLVYGDGAFTVDCVVRDVSLTGARIKLPEGQAVPDSVFLVEMRSGIAYEARVAWKRHPEIGLEFIHQHGLAEASTPHMMILKRLWMETQQRSGI
jgi:hypothetical protein